MCVLVNVSCMCLHFRVILCFYLLDLKKDLKNCLWHLILNTVYLQVSYLMSSIQWDTYNLTLIRTGKLCMLFDTYNNVRWWRLWIYSYAMGTHHCIPFMLSRLTRPRKYKTKARDHYSEYYTQENDFTIYVWMTLLKPSYIFHAITNCKLKF